MSAFVWGTMGSLLVWFAAPPEITFLSKVVIAGGFVPVIAAIQQRLSKSPHLMNGQKDSKNPS